MKKNIIWKIHQVPLLSHLWLLVMYPKNYIFSYTYSNTKKVLIQEYNPKAKEIALYFMNTLKKTLPELQVEYIGSSSFGIAGEPEIDLYVKANSTAFPKYVPLLNKILGRPSRIGKTLVQWFFTYKDYKMDIALIDPSSHQYKEEMKIIEVFRQNKEILHEYDKLKHSAIGKTIRHYQQKKLAFFDWVMNS